MVLKVISGKIKNTKFLISKFNSKNLNFTQSYIKKIFIELLALKINNINCLELFSGSASLGIELFFKKKIQLTLIEKDKIIFDYLNEFKKIYLNSSVKLINICCYKYIYNINEIKYNLIIINPPYKKINIFFSILKNIFRKKKKIYIYIENILNLNILFYYFNFFFNIYKIIKLNFVYMLIIEIF